MENAVSVQTLELLYSALLGVILGVFYDVLRTVRSYMAKKRFVTGAFDAFFWVCAIFALLTFILTYTGGRMRWYILFGAFCGGFVYRAAASEIVFKVLVGTVNAFIKVLHIATYPIYRLLAYLKRRGGKLAADTKKMFLKKRRKKKREVGRLGSKKKKKEKHST